MTSRENALIAYHHSTPSWLPSRSEDFNVIFPAGYVERYQGKEHGTDWFGVGWTYEPTIGAPMPTPNKVLLTDIAQWRDVVTLPNLDLIDWKQQAKSDTANAIDGRLNMTMNINGIFERMHACMGMQEALCALLTDPEECADFAAAITDYKLKMVEKVCTHYDIDVFNMNDDYGMHGRMFMSPDLWREMFKPLLKRIVDAVHAQGKLYHHHTCGYVEPIIGDLVEIGVDALDCLQICNKNMRAIKDQYQNALTFCGGFDNQGVFDRPGVTYDECYQETARVLNLMAPGGSYIAYTVTASTVFVPAFNQAVTDYNAKLINAAK